MHGGAKWTLKRVISLFYPKGYYEAEHSIFINPKPLGGKMVDIEVTEGLDIPIEGQPKGDVQVLAQPSHVSLNLDPFLGSKFKLLARAGDRVKAGQAVVSDKTHPGLNFVAPGSGKIVEVQRGLKRRLLNIKIELDANEEPEDLGTLDIQSASRESIIAHLKKGGACPFIRSRPFDRLANPDQAPRSIFVRAVESAPFAPPMELQVEGFEREFQAGLDVLAKLTDGSVHLVYRRGTNCQAFLNARSCERHTVSGPHPCGNASVHIHHIDPITSIEDVVWTISAKGVVTIGDLVLNGRYHTDRVVSIAGGGVSESKRGFFRTRQGVPVSTLIQGRNESGLMRLISGNPLTGKAVDGEGFLEFYDCTFTVIPENVSRELLHFFRLGGKKFTASRTYTSGLTQGGDKLYPFTTNNHGEERAFVDGSIYQKVMPMQIPVMHLVKALMAQDWEESELLGGLEIAPEDFALPAFICPCKIEMPSIVESNLREFAAEVLS